jgi:hypothetical protein
MDMKKKGIIAALAGVALAAAACKGPLDIGSFSVTGAWRGTTYVRVGTDSVAYTFALNLKQDRAKVTGTGVVRAATDSVRTSVDGSWSYPDVDLRLSAPDYGGITFNSQFVRQVSRDSLVGPLVGSGFTGTNLTLVRQTP